MRIALITDSHLSPRAPECVANWHVAWRAVERLSSAHPNSTVSAPPAGARAPE